MSCEKCGDHGIRNGFYCDCVKGIEKRVGNDFSVNSLMDYLMNNSRGLTKEEAEAHSKMLDRLSKPTGRNIFDEDIDTTICPHCNDDDLTSTTDEWLGRTIHHCDNCGKEYEVIYEVRVKEVRKR
jgi:hypothetical protein